ncbi:MAG: hypothetical protein NC087_06650 [Anaeroplasma bactoclasticum]|nr:hypothetical protein [Anaeroplasma bactoclasticum]
MLNNENKYNLIKFEDGEFSLDVNVSPDEDTVWLSISSISALFERDISVIGKHIRNIIKQNELEKIQFGQKLPTLLMMEKNILLIFTILI